PLPITIPCIHSFHYGVIERFQKLKPPMAPTLLLKPSISAPSCNWSRQKLFLDPSNANGRLNVVARGVAPHGKSVRHRNKGELLKGADKKTDQNNWRRLMKQIEDTDSPVAVLRNESLKHQALPRDLVLGTLVRFKQLKKWNLVCEVLEWLRTQHQWDFNEMDFIMLVTAYGKLGNFNAAEKVLSVMNKKGYRPNVVSRTALMEAYGRAGQYKNAEAIFRRMQSSGPEPSAVTYQIILKIFVEGNKFKEAEDVFETLLNEKISPLKPDHKMFHMMIYMHKKAGSYEKARKLFALMPERGVPRSTATYNSLMSFETSYKEVSKIYDHMQRSGVRPDVISYALLIKAYGKARREDEALAVFEEMLDAGVRPSHKAYNILLDAFAISGMVDQALMVFKNMRSDGFSPDIWSYTTMLSAYVNASDMEGAEKFFQRLKQGGVEPNVVTYGTLIKGYGKLNNLDKVLEKYEEMRLSGIKANQTIFTNIMDGYGKKGDFGSAVLWYKEMEYHGTAPDQKAKRRLLSLAKTEEERSEANLLVGPLDDSGSIQSINGAFRLVDDDDDEYGDEGDIDGNEVDDKEEDMHKQAWSSYERQDVPIILEREKDQRKEGLDTVAVISL
ncbi:hypothetical protein Tsubulata_040722, partial [Turnera subulata]